MTEQAPVLDLFFSKHGDAWRLYLAPESWAPPMLANHMDEHREIYPVREPDLDDLERHMWAGDAPYLKRVASLGGVELGAKGRSAVVMLVWVASEGVVDAALADRTE